MGTDGLPDDTTDDAVKRAAYLWEEHKYRHDLIWRLLFRLTAAAAVLAVIPFTISQDTRERAGGWVETLPGLALVLIAAGWPLLVFELKLFVPIDDKYVELQKQALGIERKVPKINIFELAAYVYPGVLLSLTIVLACIVWFR